MEHPLHASFVFVYLLVLVGVGAMKARKITDQEGFALAGRGLPTWVLVGTLLATWIGTGSIVANAEYTFNFGAPALLLPMAGSLGVLALYCLAKRIRTFEQFTIQDILEARFGLAARILATLALLGAYVIIVSYQYRSGAVVLEYVMPSLRTMENGNAYAIVGVAVFVIAYTALAGMYSVAYTDVANGVLMAVGIAVALPILLSQAGGWEHAIAQLPEGSREVTDHWTAIKLLGVLLPPFLLIIGDANMYQRFFSARSPQSARRSAVGMFVGVLMMEVAIIAVALLSTSLVAQGKLSMPDKPAHIIIHAAFNALPPVLGALLIGTVVAIVVSTADSYLLSPATSVVRDIYQRFINPKAEGKQVVFISRVCVVGLGLLALGLAFTSDNFFDVAIFAYTIYGCAITPVILAAFFWKRANHAGAVASIVTGGCVALLWESVGHFRGGEMQWADSLSELLTIGGVDLVGDVKAVLVAFPLAVAALVLVSLATKPPTDTQSTSI
ncbi:MAG: SSS family solute:Na+ symporter [Planctomycetota bacterium]|jgi:SSS family solute:Na+ symporter